MAHGKLFVISGPSGAGKGTICKEILEEAENMKLSVSMTTRRPREGEIDGVHYHFVDVDTFRRLIAEDGFMEYANVYGDNFYGTPKKQVLDWMEQGTNVILEIDVQGALQIKKTYPEGVFIFILPPSLETLRERIQGRGSETDESMARRLAEALKEISCIGEYDYHVVNEDLQEAVERLRAIVLAEGCKLDNEEAGRIVKRYKEDL